MNLTLSLSYEEQNDNKALVLTDGSNFGVDVSAPTLTGAAGDTMKAGVLYEIITPTGFDFSTHGDDNAGTTGDRFICLADVTLTGTCVIKAVTPNVSEIVSATLKVTVANSSGVSSVKPTVDLFTLFGPFTYSSDLVYTITASTLGDTADSDLVDGLYALDYDIGIIPKNQSPVVETAATTLSNTILVYGVVKVLTYDKLRTIPTSYEYSTNSIPKSILEADLAGAYLSGIKASAYVAKEEELLSMLGTLHNLVINDSKLTW